MVWWGLDLFEDFGGEFFHWDAEESENEDAGGDDAEGDEEGSGGKEGEFEEVASEGDEEGGGHDGDG